MEFFELDLGKGLGEDICNHIESRNIVELDVTKGNSLTNKMEMNINVLGTTMKSSIFENRRKKVLFHEGDSDPHVFKTKVFDDLFNVGLLTKHNSMSVQVMRETNSKKPVDRAKINNLKVVAKLFLDEGHGIGRITNDGEIISGNSDNGKIISIDFIENGNISLAD
ncbi:hypothetical protein C0995_010549 [Termitomyces sp. Mi166|nr:hypothetical protein C0995_010549 [Termitomyces sp. Mi166\